MCILKYCIGKGEEKLQNFRKTERFLNFAKTCQKKNHSYWLYVKQTIVLSPMNLADRSRFFIFVCLFLFCYLWTEIGVRMWWCVWVCIVLQSASENYKVDGFIHGSGFKSLQVSLRKRVKIAPEGCPISVCMIIVVSCFWEGVLYLPWWTFTLACGMC